MTENFQKKIRYESRFEWMLWFVAIYPFVGQFLLSGRSILSAFKYLVDILLLLLLVMNIKKIKICESYHLIFMWILLFFTYTLLGYAFNYQSIAFFLWGIRNNFRFYLFFLLCLFIFNKRNIYYFYKAFDVFLFLNVIIVSIQYWLMGVQQDYLGGLFGTERGSNGWMNILLVIVLAKAVLNYINYKEKLTKCLLIIAFCTYIAVLAEMKFYFAEMIIIVVVAILITDFSWRKLVLIIGVMSALFLGSSLLIVIYPEWKGIFSFNHFIAAGLSESGYTGTGDLNRLTGIKTIATQYMATPKEIFFGYGIGNCDYNASFNFLRTPFYETYGWLHYTWMSTTFIFFEMGAVGLVFFFGFFVVLIWKIRERIIKTREMKEVGQLAQIVAILCLFIGVYNESLRTEAAYMVYLVLSFPFLKEKVAKI